MTVYKLTVPVVHTGVPVPATVPEAVYKGCFKVSGNGAISTDPAWTYKSMTNEVQKQHKRQIEFPFFAGCPRQNTVAC